MVMVFVRSCLARVCNLQQLQLCCKGSALLFSSLVLVALGLVLQDPNNVGACDPTGPMWEKTHAYWHVCIEAAPYGDNISSDGQVDPETPAFSRESGVALHM